MMMMGDDNDMMLKWMMMTLQYDDIDDDDDDDDDAYAITRFIFCIFMMIVMHMVSLDASFATLAFVFRTVCAILIFGLKEIFDVSEKSSSGSKRDGLFRKARLDAQTYVNDPEDLGEFNE
ncbi:hypothetical protein Tco_0055523 [Tanacetum coccineum]